MEENRIVSMTASGQNMIIHMYGRIDSNNAARAEEEINRFLSEGQGSDLTIDASELEYISSAGLRILLRLRKKYPDLSVVDVNSEVYEILDMTGFTQMMNVEKAYKVMSVDGCEAIGKGANGTVYRYDDDTVIKVYNNPQALDEIQHEREVARTALILGIPTAISYDVVKVGDSFGSVFELLDASSFSKIIIEEPEKLDWCVEQFAALLRKIHGTRVPEGKLPDMRETANAWAQFVAQYLPENYARKLTAMMEAVPYDDHMIHGDYHTGNLQLQNDEVLLIDMDTLCVGDPVFEFGSIFNAFVGFGEYDHEETKRFQGYDYETAGLFWKKFLRAYFGNDEEAIRHAEDRARIVGYTRLIRRSIRRGGLETEKGKAEFELWKSELMELLDKVDSLTMTPEQLDIEAETENLPQVLAYIDKHLENVRCSPKERMEIDIAAEEIFVNIANYAYAPDKGNAIIRVEVSDEPVAVTMTFIDNGKPYDPLAKEDPDVTLSAEERAIGGLGIFMTKKAMDLITYEYKDGRNILTLRKNL